MGRRLIWLSIFAVAMAYMESAVVAYLREIYYPRGFAFPIVVIPPRMALIEIGREAATIAMLVAAAVLAGSDRWERFLHLCVAFGIWDIFYYAWLRVFLRWPESLLTWDILFLIPVPWIGPVLAPVLISAAMIAGSLWLLAVKARGTPLRLPASLWALAVAGGVLVILSFTLDFGVVVKGVRPPPFRWGLYLTGFALGSAALIAGVRRLSHPQK